MNRHMRLLMASGVLASAALLYAENEIKVTSSDDKTVTTPLNLATKISFGQNGIEISNEGSDIINIPYADAQTISFGVKSEVKFLQSQSRLALRHNPVESTLEITGHDGKPTNLSISALSGTRILSIKAWNGENVDVSSLASGIYILNINNNPIKFIKK